MKVRSLAVLLLLFLSVVACKSLFNAMRYQPVNVNVQQSQVLDAMRLELYDSAMTLVNNSKTHNLPKSELLKKLELGRLLFLAGKYQESAKLLVEAEYAIEDKRIYRYVDAFAGSAEIYNAFHPAYIGPWVDDLPNFSPRPWNSRDSLMIGNTSFQTNALYTDYVPNNLEKPLVNFYNVLNSAGLNQELWIVEAKRLGLMADILDQQKASLSLNLPYTSNPFIRLMEGLFYEAGGSLNDALISYENAFKDFDNTQCLTDYGVKMPGQLKTDILSINHKMGFTDKENIWKKKLNSQVAAEKYAPSLIIILEEGNIRHKLENPRLPAPDTIRTPIMDNKAATVTPTATGATVRLGSAAPKPAENIRIKYPFYQAHYVLNPYQATKPVLSLVCNAVSYPVNKIFNLNYLMDNAYGKRYYYELMGHGSALNADYRQWLTLPASISYVKIPLVPSQKSYTVKIVANGRYLEKLVEVENPNRTNIRHIYFPAF